MKILYVITTTDVGGAEKALARLAVDCAKTNQVRVISLRQLGPVAQELQTAGVEVISFNRRWNSRGSVAKLKKEIQKFSPDIVHAMLYQAMQYSRLACAGTKVKLICTPHFDLSKKTFLLRLVDKLLSPVDYLTVAESFATAKYLVEKQKYRKDKVYFLPNGVDKKVFFSDNSLRAQMRNKYQIASQETVFISVGRLVPAKNPLTLLIAFRNVLRNGKAGRLIYVGEGKERAKLEHYIVQNQLQKQVILAGEQDNVNAWLNVADVFVLPSVEECLPLSLLEAVTVGLPCIISRVGDMPLWVEHGKNGFVIKPGDVTLLSCLMEELIVNKTLRVQMGKNSIAVSERIGQTSQQYQHLYQQVLTDSFHVKTN